MNKKLLLFAVTMLASVTMFAQNWAKPVATNYQFAKELKVSQQANTPYWEGDTTVYYLYNVEADAFLSNAQCPTHAQWSTHAALKVGSGNAVMIAKYRLAPIFTTDTTYVEVDGEEVMKVDTTNIEIPEWDGKTYTIVDFYNNRWWYVFPTSTYAMFVDNQGQEDHMWDIKSMGNGVYRFSVSDLNPAWNSHAADSIFGNKETYFGFNKLDNDYDPTLEENAVMPLTPMLSVTDKAYNPGAAEEERMEDAELAVDWKLMPEAEFKKYESHLKAWNYLNDGKLDEYIDAVEEKYGNKIDLSKVKAFLSSTSPVLYEDIEAAIAESDKAIRDYIINVVFPEATDENPINITFLMENASLEKRNKDGWDITAGIGDNLKYQETDGNFTTFTINGESLRGYYNNETGSWISGFIEAWLPSPGKLGNGTISQTIKGLPAGKYSFTCDAIACNQGAGKQENVGVYLFAEGGGVSMKTPISTANETPENFELTFVSGGGDIVMGLMSLNADANWMAADNFELWYYGAVEGDPFEAILKTNIARYEKEYPDVDALMANQEIKDAYSAELAIANSCTADFQKEDSILAIAYNNLKQSVADYVRMESLMEEVYAKAEAFQDSDFPGLGEILGEYYEFTLLQHYNECTADAAMIDTIAATMGKMIVEHITANVKAGDELTPLISNPAFDNNFSGWSSTGATPAFGGKGGNGLNEIGDVQKLGSGNAEVFQKAFDMFQIVRNMPKGAFKLTAQAYERNDADGGRWQSDWAEGPEVGINAVLYANDFESKVNNIMAGAQDEIVYAKADESGWPTDTYAEQYEKYVPNSMDGANFYFNISPETYEVSVDFVLGHAGDSITIGLKNTYNNSWVIFDNFRLFYTGDGIEALEEPVNSMLAKLDAVLADEDSFYGADVMPKVEAVRKELADAYAANDADGVFAALDKGNEAITYYTDSKAAYEALNTAYDALTSEYYAHEESEFSEERNNAVKDALEKADHALTYFDLTPDEANELAQTMKELKSQLLLPEGGYVDLTSDMFYTWTTFDASAEQVSQAGCAFNLNQNNSMVYGDANVMYNNFADLTGADVLVLVATTGTPRLLFNRPDPPAGGSDSHGGTIPVELPRDEAQGWWTITENEDGSKTYVVDLKRITEEYGYCHLNAIKGANFADTYVTSIQLGYGVDSAIKSIDVDRKAAAGIYTISGAKVTTLQRGLNIIVDQNGKARKVFVK